MAREEELKRVDLKVNVSCCDGCRRKVMKAMSLKGVLRTEIHPSLERVTVVGNVDKKVLVKKLAKVGKIAEVVAEAAEEKQKKREGDGGKDRDGGDGPAGAEKSKRKDDDGGDRHAGAEKSKRKDDGKDTGDKASVAAAAAASYKEKDCHKCARQQPSRGDKAADHGKAKPSKAAAAARDGEGALEEEGDGSVGAKSFAPDHAAAAATHLHQYQYQYQYHRAEPPTMAVPVQHMPYYAAANVTAPSYYAPAPSYYGGGYYAMPPPPPTMPMPWRPAHRQVSRFDVDYFNEDNTVGCTVM